MDQTRSTTLPASECYDLASVAVRSAATQLLAIASPSKPAWYSNFLLRIGNGFEETYTNDYVQLLDDIIIEYSSGLSAIAVIACASYSDPIGPRGSMANPTTSSVAGPVPFEDICGVMPVPDVSALRDDSKPLLQHYQGTWVLQPWVPGITAIQHGFTPRRGDVVLASPPKCGTTWLKALAFATMARGAYPPACPEHPLLRLNPHDCVPFMEMLFATGQGSKMDALPSPRLMATHMQHSVLPASISQNSDCKIVYICRDPKDMLVSLWHYSRRALPDISFLDVFEPACEGRCLSGPIWDHVLGYWNASKASAEKVLFLKYEQVLSNPVESVRKLAQFVGKPFSTSEEEAGVVMDIVRLCSFDKMKNLDVNGAYSSSDFANHWYFRKGEVGDWVNHMTPDMARRLDAIVEEKLSGSGLSFV